MADNVAFQSSTPATPAAGTNISTEEVTTLNGGAVTAQQVQRIIAALRTADGTAIDLPGSTADGLLVNLGSNNDVTVASLPLPSGAATAANQATLITQTDGIEASLVSILAKIIAAPATEATLASILTALADITTPSDTQPVSATNLDIRDLSSASDSVAAVQSGTWNIANVSGTVSLPTGAATAAKQDTLIAQTDAVETSLTSIDGKLPALGQALAAASVPVILPAATITTLTPPAAITGFATAVKQPALGTAGTASADVITVQGITSMTPLLVNGSGVTQPVSDAGGSLTVDGTVAATQSGTWTVQPGNTANTTPWLVKEARSSTATTTSVNDTASSTTILASNSARLGATVYNDSTVVLYLKLGATASTTSFTVKMQPDGYFEVPFGYTGIIDGIWASDASGAARIVELT